MEHYSVMVIPLTLSEDVIVLGERLRVHVSLQLHVTLPYDQDVSDSIKRVLGSVNIRVSFKPLSSSKDLLSHPN